MQCDLDIQDDITTLNFVIKSRCLYSNDTCLYISTYVEEYVYSLLLRIVKLLIAEIDNFQLEQIVCVSEREFRGTCFRKRFLVCKIRGTAG